ncbi:MAG TPA: DUF4105 domain-containing protein [Aquabacterium sp.]|uniref:Lnb N-terminal periplasmic domain-containing protein n=1 Tax=Aquabacterium sp. TaxID=1872578 RepID=UPI002E32C369|nr:DUF4105 domain-containing protein [Aquabacterium sp.]HEX5356026.1 DUF4105 domain-containing protein [Aquabacterium sp.]
MFVRIRSLVMGLGALALVLASSWSTAAPVATQQDYIRTLQQAARHRHLADSPMWRTLLHYRVQPLTRQDRSLADDRDFFLAPDGAHAPEQELDATLAAFFDPTVRHALDQPAACRFIARYQWLQEELGFDPQQLPPPDCPRYRQWREGIQADKVTLIFPSAYLNSPASMYGHTFLRLDPQPAAGQNRSPLLSYAVNYAANGNENEGIAYALKGLTGLYAGQFTNAPYYLRIREYNDLENRDIWEYELALTPKEIDRLLAHTWELGPTRFDYYFFDENCSYHLLSLLDAARPELGLTDRFTWWAIPLDTVKAVTDTPGLLKAIRYRPSNSTELRYRANLLGPQGAGLAQQLSQGQLPPAELMRHEPSADRRALMLETAERLTSFEATRKDSTEAATQRERMALLTARAALPAGDPLTVPTPSTDPTQGHNTARTDIMVGQRNGHGVVLIQAKPAYHELLDPEPGYQRGAAIQFFSLMLGKTSDGHLQLEKLIPVEITSLSAREPLLSAKSWRVHIGLERADNARADGSRPLGINLNGGPGLAYELTAHENLMGYVFLDNQARWDRSLPRQPWAVGTGLAAGLLADVSPAWRLQLEVFQRAYLDHQPKEAGLLLQTRYSLSKQWNLHGRCATSQRSGMPVNQECTAGLQRYW